MTHDRLYRSIVLIFRQLPKDVKAYGLLTILFSLIAGFAEALTIGSVLPLVASLTQADNKHLTSFLSPISEAYLLKDSMAGTFLLLALLILITGILRVVLLRITQGFTRLAGVALSQRCFERLLDRPYEFHITHASSETISLISHKVQAVVNHVLLATTNLLTAAMISIIIFFFLCTLNLALALLMGALLTVMYVLVGYFSKARISQVGHYSANNHTKVVHIVQEALGNIREVLLGKLQPIYVNNFSRYQTNFLGAQYQAAVIIQSKRFIVELISMLMMLGLAYYLMATGSEGALALAFLGVYAFAAQRLLPLFHQMYACWGQLRNSQSMLMEILISLQSINKIPYLTSPLSLNNTLRLDHVCFHYPGHSTHVFNDLSLEIRQGERLGIVGPSGSGKTTLIDLISGLLKPQSGHITIDGTPLNVATVDAWQQNIGYVPQQIFLSDQSIAENIAMGVARDHIDTKRMEDAARSACLHPFVTSLPEGYDTLCGENGIRLSGGQRQRIGIARALYAQKPVLILDEPTSALDLEAEGEIVQTLLKLSRTVTILIVTHRESLALACDRILTIREGQAIECHDLVDGQPKCAIG